MDSVQTEILNIAFEDEGPRDGSPVLLLHGWPDAPRGWHPLAAHLHAAGYRTITPWLRGFGPTRFLDEATPRVGAAVALTQDAIDLADALGLGKFAVVGHDWGARAAYTLAALFPNRVTHIAALALAWQPRGIFRMPAFDQARRFWYQWFLCVDGGVQKVQDNPVGFARIQWETWSPRDWFDHAEFDRTAESFLNPDWAAITANAYRIRWRQDEIRDPRYDQLQHRLSEIERIATPALMIQGASDQCDPPSESEGLESYFTARYERRLLEGVGHFPHREAADDVANAVLAHLRT